MKSTYSQAAQPGDTIVSPRSTGARIWSSHVLSAVRVQASMFALEQICVCSFVCPSRWLFYMLPGCSCAQSHFLLMLTGMSENETCSVLWGWHLGRRERTFYPTLSQESQSTLLMSEHYTMSHKCDSFKHPSLFTDSKTNSTGKMWTHLLCHTLTAHLCFPLSVFICSSVASSHVY